MRAEKEGLILIVGVIILISVIVVGVVKSNIRENKTITERCQVYCNCSITQDCLYTFDYDEVKDCECDE